MFHIRNTNTVKIKMLSDATGSNDGIHIEKFIEGVEYDVSESLFESFKNMGWCELVNGDVIDTPVIEKKIEAPVVEKKITRKRKPRKTKDS